MWKPGQSGNPGGRTVAYAECQRLAREVSLESTERLIEIMRQKRDLRAAIVASEALYKRAWGDTSRASVPVNPLEQMTPEQRRARIAELLAYAATLKPPEDAEIIEGESLRCRIANQATLA
jgi:hypothetical protein